MAALNIPDLTSPISTEDPCGPDLELAGDVEFMNFMARTEGGLPATYFSGPDSKPFDRSTVDLEAEFAGARAFLAATRDIRLLVVLAKLCILSRDLQSFVTVVQAVASLLEERWPEVHPRGDAGEFGMRVAVLETLDDTAPVIFPLQYTPLLEHRRLGPITFRHFMFAKGEAQPREGEPTHDLASLEKAALETDLAAIIARRDQIEALRRAMGKIRTVCAERLGPAQAPNLQKVSDLTDRMFTLLNDFAVKLDPSAGVDQPAQSEAETAAPATAFAGRVTSRKEAAAALEAAASYFIHHEPSSPALLLIRQAQQLVGKSLFEVLQILMPGRVEEAKVRLGKDQTLQIPVDRQAQLAGESVISQSSGDAQTPDEANTAPAGFRARSRQEAFALLDQIAGFYRVAEPSSPIALIAERARGLGDRDFVTLLKELLATPE